MGTHLKLELEELYLPSGIAGVGAQRLPLPAAAPGGGSGHSPEPGCSPALSYQLFANLHCSALCNHTTWETHVPRADDSAIIVARCCWP